MASDWVVAAAALIAGASGGFGSFITSRTTKGVAQQRAEAELEQLKETSDRQHAADRWERFAAFQMHKRAVYSPLLEAGQTASYGSAAGVPNDWSKQIARALVIAEGPLREELLTLRDAELPLGKDPLESLIRAIQTDVDKELTPSAQP
ncbi:hypothetical protein [Streptomyces sp. NPDC000878]